MSRDEARQHIRAAQEAEIAGNKDGAVRHLERAALEYVRVGMHGRAAQMYKNCLRLAPDRKDLAEALQKAEQWAEKQSGRAPGEAPPIVSSEGFDALAIPRGPQRTLPGLEAWCSFCCRPTKEVGVLVAGPAGAFICAECVGTSAGMLDVEPAATSPEPAPTTLPAARGKSPVALVEPPRRARVWLGAEPVLLAARAALTGRGPSIVLVGPEGSGKSALLDSLGDERPELARVDLAATPEIPGHGPLLVEQLQLATPAQRAALLDRSFVAAWRAEVEPEPLVVKAGETMHAFSLARGFALPPELGSVLALALATPDAPLLQRLLERSIEECDGPILAPAVQEALVQRALQSGRGAKGLLAELGVLRALPSGAAIGWAGEPAKRRRRKKP